MFPYIIINVAMSINGKISSANGRYNISTEEDIHRTMNLRNRVDAVLIGANTVMVDNPILRNAKNRIILDAKFKLNENFHVFDGSVKTYIFSLKNKKINNTQTVVLEDISLENILNKIRDLGIETILVEGGANVINQFIHKNIFNEFYIFINPKIVLSGKSLFENIEIKDMEYSILKSDNGILLSINRIPNMR